MADLHDAAINFAVIFVCVTIRLVLALWMFGKLMKILVEGVSSTTLTMSYHIREGCDQLWQADLGAASRLNLLYILFRELLDLIHIYIVIFAYSSP
jgi:hypothetical protein